MVGLRPILFRTTLKPIGWIAKFVPAGRLGHYILFISAVGALLIGYSVGNLPLSRPHVLIALWLMSFALECTPIKLVGTPLQGTSLSVSAAVAFAALLILGPAGSIVVNTGSALAYCVRENRPFYKRLFTTAALVCSSAVSALIYALAGGTSPLALETKMFYAAGLAACAYFLANSSLISGAVSLSTGRPFRTVLSNWQWLFLQMLASLAVGLIMALAYTTTLGSFAFLLVSILLLLPWYSTYVYVQKSRQVSDQNERLNEANKELERANRSLDFRVGGLKAIHSIGISLNSAQTLPAIFQQILTSVRALTGAGASAIFLYDPAQPSPSIAGQIGLSDRYLEHPELALNGSAARALREGRLLVMDKNNYVPALLSSAAINDGIRTAACLPINVAGELVGGLDVCFKLDHAFAEDELDLLRTLAEQAAVAIQNARLIKQIHENYLSTIGALAATVEAKDPYTRGHSEVVRQLAIAIGRQLNLSRHQIELLNIGALFHDIGKIGISEAILNKPDRLTEAEWVVMRQHPIIGEQILSKVPALSDAPSIVRHHHERFDQSGYPDGICAREDLLAAIVSVCDSYQAMTSDRTYRKAFSHGYALEQIRLGSGTQFVPEVVEAFNAVIEQQDLAQLKSLRFDSGLLLHTTSRLDRLDSQRDALYLSNTREQVA